MKTIDASAFNESVLKEIERTKYTIDNNITSENILYFPYSALSTYQDGVANQKDGNIEQTRPAWDYNSNVNGVELSRIRTAINYLKSFKTKTIVQEFDFNPYIAAKSTDMTNKHSVKYQYKIKIPDNYDGRNSFVEYTISSHFIEGDKTDENATSAQRGTFWKPEDFCRLWINQMNKNETYDAHTALKIYRNKNEVVIDVLYPKKNVESTTGVLLDYTEVRIKGRITMWRLS